MLVDKPVKQGRVEILKVHMKAVKLASDVDAGQVAALTPSINTVERVVAGLEKKNRVLNPRECDKKLIDYIFAYTVGNSSITARAR